MYTTHGKPTAATARKTYANIETNAVVHTMMDIVCFSCNLCFAYNFSIKLFYSLTHTFCCWWCSVLVVSVGFVRFNRRRHHRRRCCLLSANESTWYIFHFLLVVLWVSRVCYCCCCHHRWALCVAVLPLLLLLCTLVDVVICFIFMALTIINTWSSYNMSMRKRNTAHISSVCRQMAYLFVSHGSHLSLSLFSSLHSPC